MCLAFAIHVFSKFILRITLTSQGKKVLQFSFFNIAYLSPMNKYLACSNVNYCLNLENSEAWNWICIHSFFIFHLCFEMQKRKSNSGRISDIIYFLNVISILYSLYVLCSYYFYIKIYWVVIKTNIFRINLFVFVISNSI